jgi:hypothetical protein
VKGGLHQELATCVFASTGQALCQASKPNHRNWRAARALVASSDQVQ